MEPSKPNSDPMSPPQGNTPSNPQMPGASMSEPSSMPSPSSMPTTSMPMGNDMGGAPSGPAVEMPAAAPVAVKSGGKKWLLPTIVGVVAVVLLSASYVFAFYLPNTPDAIYKTSLQRSGEAVDALVAYSNTAADKKYKSTDFDGKLQAKTSSGSFDATLSGSLDEDANGTGTLKANIMGEKINMDVRSIHVDGNTSPDVYFQLSGIKPMLDSYGMSELSSLDGKWISVDHTIIDTVAAAYSEEQLATATSSPTPEQLQDAVAKVQTVNKDYIFTTDADKAVLQKSSYVGKETKDGKAVHHFKVGYNKDHLLAYVTAVGKALDESKLNDWSKAGNGGQNLSKMMDLEALKDSVRDAKSSYTFDVWVDAKTKLIRTVSFVDPGDVNSEFSITQNYDGGDEYPFAMAITAKDPDSGTAQKAEIDLTVNTKSDKVDLKVTYDDGANEVTLTVAATPSGEAVKVTAPTGATPVTQLLNELGLGGML